MIFARLAKLGAKVIGILHTHGHIDHMGGSAELTETTGAPLYLHREDRALFDNAGAHAMMFGLPPPKRRAIDHDLRDHDILTVGTESLTVIHTPGHSRGGVSFYIESADTLLCGDTLFAGGVGRTDLPGGDFNALANSIRDRLYTLPGHTTVIPGHGPKTTVDREKRNNPFVRG